MRKSSRLRGIEPPAIEIETESTLEIPKQQGELVNDELWDGKLLKADEYFDEVTCQNAIRTQGNFTGWINPELIEKYQFELSATEAWEKNGGGKFSFKDPSGTGKKKTGSRTSAKAISQMMFKKNPNMYFYRHNEPGVEQWTGDWTPEEKEVFLKVAREHGCGDKVCLMGFMRYIIKTRMVSGVSLRAISLTVLAISAAVRYDLQGSELFIVLRFLPKRDFASRFDIRQEL
ncbi:hypothetical protein DFQ29_010215 [Apophysomyces sp. BC1021]|nr:hypothetical protein DFQ29_010215 [Apophysomyces sp. BC1021]